MKQRAEIAHIPLWSLFGRIFAEHAVRPLFPRFLNDKTGALEKAELAAKKGVGLVIVYTHFSLRDGMETNRSIVYTSPVLRDREVVNPLSYHQYNKLMKGRATFFHGTFIPIVNNSTLSKKGYENMPKGKGLQEFAAACSEVLSKGGIATLAVNSTRMDKLDLAYHRFGQDLNLL